MDQQQRDALRQHRAPGLLEKLRADLLEIQKKALPKSAAGQAASYALSLWSKLTLFLMHPELELSNNLAENSMRPIAIGRKNWLHLGSQQAGPKIAAIFSVVESCRRLGVPFANTSQRCCPASLTAPSTISPISRPALTPPKSAK